ncbi:MAG: hypothetical protein KDE05_05910 [Parvularculaceae bacterium]|nr:hypothetical protein [Parvularculaceae bacterium]
MEVFGVGIWAILGFAFAAYAVVGNDALQTLGTFISSNQKLPWWALFLFASTVLIVVFIIGYIQFDGDPSWGRLSNAKKYPEFEAQWYHVVPAAALLVITRLGLPVSTSFMILSIFATMAGMQSMVQKSAYAYAMSLGLGLASYIFLAPTLERHFMKTPDHAQRPHWILFQWVTTAYLWAVWLIQDFANIYVFLPRQLSMEQAVFSVCLIMFLLMITFINGGGPVQRILKTKTSVTDIRSATLIDFFYASILAYFAYVSKTPMSTTWAFLGFIGGREIALATIDKVRSPGATLKIVSMDAGKALLGLVISVGLAVGLPRLAAAMTAG